MNNGDSPASPLPFYVGECGVENIDGLTKREHFAAIALQGLCSYSGFNSDAPRKAVLLADALLKALEDV